VGYTDLPIDLVNVNAGEFERAMARGAGETFEVVDGRVVIVPVKPSEFHDWDTKSNQWILSTAKAAKLKAAELAAAKSAKLSEIATAAQALIDQIVFDAAPAFERETYALQAAEALAWSRDKSAKTPVLDGIAAARGVPTAVVESRAFKGDRAGLRPPWKRNWSGMALKSSRSLALCAC
jgi:hypothetical protein